MPQACKTKEIAGKAYRCYFELALEVIGGKWKPIILYHLALDGVLRFSELRRSLAGVSDRMLTRQLRELEKDGLVRREVYKEVPPKVEYSLSELGCGLFPILLSMRQWGVKFEASLSKGNGFCAQDYEQPEALPRLNSYYAALNPAENSLKRRLSADQATASG